VSVDPSRLPADRGAGGSRCRLLWLSLLALVTSPLPAAELSFLYGNTVGDAERTNNGRPWQVEYLQQPLTNFALSFSYLNEAQLKNADQPKYAHHARDGGALQFWATTPRWFDSLQLAAGAGPYAYFDTQSEPQPIGYRDYHSVALLYSVAIKYYTPIGLFAQLRLNEIHAPGNVDDRTLELGIGYRVHSQQSDAQLWAPSQPSLNLNQFAVLVGQTDDSNWNDSSGTAYELEYRRGLTRHLEVSGLWLDESDGSTGRHYGVAPQAWVTDDFIQRRLIIGIGAGPFFALRDHEDELHHEFPHVSGLVSMTAAYQATSWLLARFEWHRGFTNDSQDRDVILLGLAVAWH